MALLSETGKNTGKIREKATSQTAISHLTQYFRAFRRFSGYQLTGKEISNNREKAKDIRENNGAIDR